MQNYILRQFSSFAALLVALQPFCSHTLFPRPGGGTIAAGNRDSPPGRLRPTGRVELGRDLWFVCMHPILFVCTHPTFALHLSFS